MTDELRPRVLVADDEPSIRYVLRETLEDEGCEVLDVEDGDSALERLAAGGIQLAFLDIRMPGPSGLELLDRLRQMGSDTAVVIITAQSTFENAVEAMKRGALDYLVKPFGMAEVRALAGKALRVRALQREVHELRREVGRQTAPGDRLVGKSAALLEVFKTIGRVSGRDVAVLITGESGTGKELVARAIHAASLRADCPFVAVNTAAIPRDLLESELFGHERGAFTGAVAARVGRFREASCGTLFLDEIGDMPVDLQAKLLRVLQEGEVTPVGGSRPERVDVRIIAATHSDPDSAVREGRFREDLLYRLRVVPIQIPPLRERREDIPPLVDAFLRKHGAEVPRALSAEAMRRLVARPWRGNARELENVIERALALCDAPTLGVGDLLLDGRDEAGDADPAGALLESASGGRLSLRELEDAYIEEVLRLTGGNKVRAARILGIDRKTLYRRAERKAAP